MTCTRLLLIVFTVWLTQPVAQALDLPAWLRLPKLPQSSSKEPVKLPSKSVRVGDFTGGTGTSARRSLLAELTDSREFTLTDSGADFLVTGSSTGGRVMAKLERADGKVLFERTYAAPGLDENLRALSDDIIFSATGKPGQATSRIVFVSNKSGTKQVYVCDSHGRDVQQVTHHTHGAVSPTLSPDGSAIAYTSYRSGFPVVQVLDLGLGWERTVTDTPGSSFGAAFAPDGQRLALVMSFIGNPEIFVTDLASNTAACISDTVGAPSSPSWHPDGKQIIFADDRGQGPRLYIAEVPATNNAEARLYLWRTGYSFCTDPEFSPDGKQVAFVARQSDGAAIVVKDYPSGKSRVVQTGGAQHPSWSPNGRYLCYTQHGALYVHDLHTGLRNAILGGYSTISEPRWMR